MCYTPPRRRSGAAHGMTPGNPFLHRARTVARWGVAAGVLAGSGYYLATRTDRVALVRALRSTDYLLVLAMTVGHIVVVLPIKAWRWGRMLAPIRRLRLWRLFHYFLTGCASSIITSPRAPAPAHGWAGPGN